MILLFIVGLIAYFISTAMTKPALQNGEPISPQEVKDAIGAKEKVTIVDVRTPEEYKTGHLKNSVLLPLDALASDAAKTLPDKNQMMYIYCRTGGRSAKAVTELQQIGYADVYSMDGGITAWQDSGYLVEK